MAELKRKLAAALAAEAARRFHGFTAVAELKPDREHMSGTAIHDVSTASPPWPN